MKNFKRQKGVAVIIVALSMVAIGGMAQLTIEGGRMIQERDRLADATEAATLAVAIANSDEQHVSDELARKYLENYLPNIDIGDVQVTRTEGKEEIDGNQLYYVQYEVGADVGFERQMGFIDSSSDSSSYKVGNDAMARTYMLPSDLDLVFVADFSGSMAVNKWGDKYRIDHLKEQVGIISKDLLSSGATNAGYAHRIGFVPFNMRTQEKLNDQMRCVTELEYVTKSVNGVSVPYGDINWVQWGAHSWNDVTKCYSSGSKCPSYLTQEDAQRQAAIIRDVFYESKYEIEAENIKTDYYRYPDPKSYVDIKKTVANWRISKTENLNLHPRSNSNGTELYDTGFCNTNSGFYTLPLSLEAPNIQNMEASGWTSVYQGLIRGAQLLADGRPTVENEEALEDYYKRAQMLLILSDGEEKPFTQTFSELVNAGLCDKIRKHFEDHDRLPYIGVIGIDFEASAEKTFEDCADEIIDVDDSKKLLEKIQELIQKGAATNGVSRLYDKNL
ncbi:TadE/TadG family type IV pilus assembly protein [Vibrio neonatus]|uniref:TadE/TadG family type IV pilus assembly protein n=1 Tax=Vibrio neonatus TaxID=278860 RepID=UPI0021C31C20|nr:Tad domain-containing protein [Vibrio neonatus]